MESDRIPSRPVVKSQLSAESEWARWLQENNFSLVPDSEGLVWTLTVNMSQIPDPVEARQAKWIVQLNLAADVDSDQFLKTGVLDSSQDARLLELIGAHKVPLRMKPVVHEATGGEKEAKDLLIRVLPELRENIAKTKLRDVKRTLIGRWVESQSLFGAREAGRGW
jgi:hypothetical protein